MLHSGSEKYNREEVKWSCRRGMLELDKILNGFFEKEFDSLANSKKQAFVDLLKFNDTQLQDWLIGSKIPHEFELQDLVLCIRYFSRLCHV